jgi:hypothetical protein
VVRLRTTRLRECRRWFGVRISNVDEAVVALRVDEKGLEASVVLWFEVLRKDVRLSVVWVGRSWSLLRSGRNAADGTVVVRGVSRPARTRLGKEKPARRWESIIRKRKHRSGTRTRRAINDQEVVQRVAENRLNHVVNPAD